ncbi:MAG: thiamine pyrophosphokinase [Sphingobacteriaceae bacterium]|nr:thiamine pyrophosphokinase [Sphingobacteriaceae bacterium]
MSSHHIVKEKQEPALYIHQFGDFEEEYLGQLLEWSPTLLAGAMAYEKINSLGIKVDILLANETDFALQEHLKVIPIVENEVHTALSYLIENGFPAVNIICLSVEDLAVEAYSTQLNILLLDSKYKKYRIVSGYSVWKPAGLCFLIAHTADLIYTNLQHKGGNEYEVIADGLVSFQFDAKHLFITEKI